MSGVLAFPAARELLSANRTYYVRTDGSNSNSGRADSAGGAWLTWQYAIDTVVATLDFGGYTVTIAHGEETGAKTFTAATTISKPWTGGGELIISGSAGDLVTPTDLLFSLTNADAFTVACVLPAALRFRGMAFTSVTYGNFIAHYGVGSIYYKTIVFQATAYAHITAGNPGTFVAPDGNYTITGGGVAHISLDGQGAAYLPSTVTVTLTGTPAFSDAFVAANADSVITSQATFSGGATGSRYRAGLLSVINTYGAGANYFPGNAAGSTATGSQYA